MRPIVQSSGPMRALSNPHEGASSMDVLRLSLGLLIVMVVSRVHQTVPGLAPFRPGLLLVLAAGAYAFLRPNVLTQENVLRYWWTRCIAFLVVQACLSVAFGISIGASGKFFLQAYSTVVVLAALVIVATRTTRDLVVFVTAYLIGIAALTWQTNFLFKLSTGAGLARLAELYTFDANDVGLIFVTAFPIAVALFPVWSGWRRWIIVLLILAVGAGIARSGSRGAFLALVVSGGLMLILSRGVPASKRIALTAAILLALVFAAPPGYFKQMNTIVNPTTDYNWTSPTGRRAVTKRGFGYMMSYPLFGVGISNFNKAECTLSERLVEEAPGVGIRCTAPHSTWVQVGAELGIPGLILWFTLLAIPIVRLLHLSRRLPLGWLKGDLEQRFLFACTSALPISLIGFMIASTFLTFAWLDLPYLLVIFSGSTWLFTMRRLGAGGQAVPARHGSPRPFRRQRSG